MSLRPCAGCKKITVCPVHVTEIEGDGKVRTLDFCRQCGQKYTDIEGPMEEIPMNKEKQEKVDLTNITTPQQLLEFLAGIRGEKEEPDDTPPCSCGMTVAEFDKTGVFGCPECYNHFTHQMEKLVFPWHKAKKHVGKVPKRWLAEKQANDPVEKLKLLKQRFDDSVPDVLSSTLVDFICSGTAASCRRSRTGIHGCCVRAAGLEPDRRPEGSSVGEAVCRFPQPLFGAPRVPRRRVQRLVPEDLCQ